MPATPTRITSLAPSTRPEDFVPAMVKSGNAALAAAPFRKLRRVIMLILTTVLMVNSRFPCFTATSEITAQPGKQVCDISRLESLSEGRHQRCRHTPHTNHVLAQ